MWNFSAASVGLPAYVGLPCKAMARQAHVEPLRWLCWPATQASRKQMSSPDTHQYTNTQGPVPLKKNRGRRPRSPAKRERRTSFGNPHEQPRHRWPKPIHRLLEKQLSLEVPGGPTPFKGDLKKGACGSPWGARPVRKLRKKETHGHAFRWGQQAIVCAPATPQSRRLILLTSVTYVFYILGCLCAPSGFMFLNFMYAHLCTQKQ